MGFRRLKIRIDFAREDYRYIRFISIGLGVIILLLLFLLWSNVRVYLTYKEDIAKVREGIGRLKAEAPAKVTKGEELTRKVSFAKEVLKEVSFSWTLFLNEIEKAIPDRVSINRINPLFSTQEVEISGRTLSLKELTELIISLEESPFFDDVFLSSQSESEDKEGQINFVMRFKYNQFSK